MEQEEAVLVNLDKQLQATNSQLLWEAKVLLSAPHWLKTLCVHTGLGTVQLSAKTKQQYPLEKLQDHHCVLECILLNFSYNVLQRQGF